MTRDSLASAVVLQVLTSKEGQRLIKEQLDQYNDPRQPVLVGEVLNLVRRCMP